MVFMEIVPFSYENHANTQVHSVDKTTYALMVQLVVLMVTCVSYRVRVCLHVIDVSVWGFLTLFTLTLDLKLQGTSCSQLYKSVT
jgi:hypothetical protein